MNIKTYVLGIAFIIAAFGSCSATFALTLFLEGWFIIVGVGIIYLIILSISLICMKYFRKNNFLFYTLLSIIIGYPLALLIAPAVLFTLIEYGSGGLSINQNILFYLPLLYLISSPVLIGFYKDRQFVAYTGLLSLFPTMQCFFVCSLIIFWAVQGV